MTVATVLLVLLAGVATFFVAKASLAIVQMKREAQVARRHAKAVLREGQRLNATSQRILDRAYRYQEKLDVLMLDPKVQAALNRHEGVRHG